MIRMQEPDPVVESKLPVIANALALVLVALGAGAAILQAYGVLPSPVDRGALVLFIVCILFLFFFGGTIRFTGRER